MKFSYPHQPLCNVLANMKYTLLLLHQSTLLYYNQLFLAYSTVSVLIQLPRKNFYRFVHRSERHLLLHTTILLSLFLFYIFGNYTKKRHLLNNGFHIWSSKNFLICCWLLQKIQNLRIKRIKFSNLCKKLAKF